MGVASDLCGAELREVFRPRDRMEGNSQKGGLATSKPSS